MLQISAMDLIFCPGGRTPSTLMFLILFLLLSSAPFSPTLACFPRSRHSPRYYRRQPPLVYKERIPANTPEWHPRAAGGSKGIVYRGTYEFSKLKENYNPDIVFLDEEGTGEDRIMTRRASEKLNTLALLVMQRWPSKRLRVTEAWDDSGVHARDSLHYEGRAVDITLDDHDYAEYGHLARLASQAGFDFVYYESQAHVHASVKHDGAPGTRLRGCFPNDAQVQTPGGLKAMEDLEIGDLVLSIHRSSNASKNFGKNLEPVYSPVIAFAHKLKTARSDFVEISTSSGEKMVLTPNHLVPKLNFMSSSNFEESNQDSAISTARNHTSQQKKLLSRTISFADFSFSRAENINLGDIGAVLHPSSEIENNDSKIESRFTTFEKVTKISKRVSATGLHAPITESGSIFVNNVLASCYADAESEVLAHAALWPIRWAYWWFGNNFLLSPKTDGDVHWYFRVLVQVAENFLGWNF